MISYVKTGEIEEFIKQTGFCKEEEEHILSHSLSPAVLMDMYYKMKALDEDFLASLDDPETALYVIPQLACLCHRDYEIRGISDEIFYETMKDIALWAEDYRIKNNKIGLTETIWLMNHLRLSLFCLGSLQFEVVEKIPEQYPDYEGVTLSLHIPKGADISSSAVEEAFSKALSFFGEDEIRFICSSWLLSDELSSLLDEKSNIRIFAGKFSLVYSDMNNTQAEERIFGTVLEDKSLYPCSTSLQQKAKAFLLEGGLLPVSYGFLFRYAE